MKKFLLSFLCFLLAVAGGYAKEVTDVLDRSTTGITGTNYSSWSGKKHNSAAVYAGQSAGSNSSIQLRSNNSNSGIITTTSGGKVKKIVVVWNNSTSSGRTLDVYGKNTAYSSPTDLYKSDPQGTKLGSIKCGTSTELVIDGDYEYIGLRSNSGAMYLTSVSIIWEDGETGGVVTPVAPNAPTLSAPCNFYYTMDVGITNIPDGATVYYTTDNSASTALNGTEYTVPFKITETTTVKAIAVNEAGSSEEVSATYTKIEVPEGQVVDVLNREWTGVASLPSYSDWIGKTSNSSAVYAGNSAGDNDAIQLRSDKSNSGIVTTTSGGKVKKIVVVWNSETSTGRTLDVYGKNTAYSKPTDLYNSSTQGTKLGSIKYGTSTEFTITGDYAYIGLRSNSGAMYLNSIVIVWDCTTGGGEQEEQIFAPVISPEQISYNEGESCEVKIDTKTEGAGIYYTLDGTDPTTESTLYEKSFSLTQTTTVKAIAVKDNKVSEIVSKTFTFIKNITLNPVSVAEAKAAYKPDVEIKNAIVVGYIVGAAKNGTLNQSIFGANQEVKTNILIADDPNETNVENCMPVELPSGDIRNALNLAENPGNYKKQIVLTGSVTAYFSVAGLKNTSAYEFIEDVWGSLYYPTAVEIPANVKAYIVTAANNNYVTLTQVTGALPANTGIIYNGKWTEKGSAVSGEANVEGNLLEGTVDATNILKEAYVLAKVDGEVGFYKAAMNQLDGTAFLNNANKAYLPVDNLPSSVQNAKALKFDFNTTAVENVKVETEGKKVIYDLSGRRVNDMTAPGLYIVNGKKVMVK